MGGIIIPEVKKFTYLGLPIGDKNTMNEFWKKKFL